MVERDPTPQGIAAHCVNCGRRLTEEATIYRIPECRADSQLPLRFCSETCAEAYSKKVCKMQEVDEELEEEAELMERSGPT